MRNLFVARHGRINVARELADEGREDAHRIAARLKEAGEFVGGIILSSTVPRALDTAHIVRTDLGLPRLFKSDYISLVGNRPQPVEDLRAFAGNVLTACGADHDEADVLLVAHKPLVEAAAGPDLEDGGIYPIPEGWKNPKYEPGFEFLIDHSDMWGR
jgi:phosphohistidine phosphatase SixA